MRTNLFLGAAMAALILPSAAFAQSTGSADATGDIVVTGAVQRGIAGVQIPDTPKNKEVLTQEYIARQTPGQSILDTINQLPGVSFQNNDPFGSAGGTLSIRGFDASRIALTFDGIPLNDTGNYALYSNQQLDPELIENVNVNLGSTDVDTPSAAATGSTVNYRTINPTEDFGVRMVGSVGDFSFRRVFGLINTGRLTSFGTKAWISGSNATNDVVFNNFGKIDKQQYNAKIYQPIGNGTDFISVSGNYNQNRNNFFGSVPLRTDSNIFTSTGGAGANAAAPTLVTGAVRTPGTATTNRFAYNRDELPYQVARCTLTPGTTGVNNVPNTCGTSYDERVNPSNTGSIRINSKFSFGDKTTLYIDPSYQYTKANGGGTVRGQEGGYTQTANATRGAITTPQYGFIGGSYYFGRDLNGDGDTLDRTTTVGTVTTNGGVTLLAPSQTVTHRYGIIASLRYEFSKTQNIRYGYSHDYGRHRQTGELGLLRNNGSPFDVFPSNNPLTAVNGQIVQKRDRLSYAVLDQFFASYHGEFLDSKLRIDAGLTEKFFRRNLTNFCFTTAANGNVDCFGRGNTGANSVYAAANPYSTTTSTTGVTTVTGYAAPQNRVYTYDKLLPSGGISYNFDRVQVFASYQKGIQVPGTDNLYQAFYFPRANAQANPVPETSDNFDSGLRYSSSIYQVSIGPWYTRFQNRLASAFDQDTQSTFYRNLGKVEKYGVDVDLSVRPASYLVVHAFGSYLKSKIKDNVVLGVCPATLTAANTTNNCTTAGAPILALTKDKRESGFPVYTFGGSVTGTAGPLEISLQTKATGERYLNDQNIANLQCTVALVNQICPTVANVPTTYTGTRGIQYQVYGSKAPAYVTVDINARLALDFIGLNKQTYLQMNLQNLFNEFYVGGVAGGATTQFNVPFAQIGSPRAVVFSINTQF